MKIFQKKLEIRKSNWKKFKELRKNGKYAILVYLQKTLLKFVLMFQKNPNFVFCFCEEFYLQRKMNFYVENQNFENIFFNPFDS